MVVYIDRWNISRAHICIVCLDMLVSSFCERQNTEVYIFFWERSIVSNKSQECVRDGHYRIFLICNQIIMNNEYFFRYLTQFLQKKDSIQINGNSKMHTSVLKMMKKRCYLVFFLCEIASSLFKASTSAFYQQDGIELQKRMHILSQKQQKYFQNNFSDKVMDLLYCYLIWYGG